VKNSLFLLIAYVVGQGSVFLFQIHGKFLGEHQLVGISVIVISLVSFCIQFSDVGNVTYLVKNINVKDQGVIDNFLRARAAVGVVLALIITIPWYLAENPGIDGLVYFLILLPFFALLNGLYRTAYLEVKNNYLFIALVQVVPWVLIALLFYLILFSRIDSYALIVSVLIFACLVANRILNELNKSSIVRDISAPVSLNDVRIILPFMVGQLGGQVWGRVLIFLIAANGGLASLGDFGIVRNVYIALILIIGFALRPALRNFIISMDKVEAGESNYFYLIKKTRYVFLVSVAVSCLSLLIYGYDFWPGSEWVLMISLIPLVMLGQMAAKCNQIDMSPRKIIYSDYAALLVNVFVFLILLESSVLLAIVAGELVQFLLMIVLRLRFESEKYKTAH